MRRSPHIVVHMESPQVFDTLAEPFNCSVWEIVRRFGRPVILAEVTLVLHSQPAVVQRALERLEKLGLITRMPARGDRRAPTYETTSDGLVVGFNPDQSSECQAASDLKARLVAYGRRILEEDYAKNSNGDVEQWSSMDCVPVRLTPTDIAEVSRNIHVLNECIDRIRGRATKIDSSQSQDCNYLIRIEAQPTRSPVLPLPSIHVVPYHRIRETIAKVESASMNALSAREREVAIELARGLSRPEIATQLGVSVNTIATIGKRIYAKLGIHRRAELSARLHGIADKGVDKG